MPYSARKAFTLPIISLCAVLSTGVADAQTKEEALSDFDFVLEVVRRDYAGFPIKVTGAKAAEFEALVRAKRLQLEQAPTDELAIVKGVLAWFRDRHLGFSQAFSPERANTTDIDDARLAAQGPFISITSSRGRHPLGGTTWASVDGNYRATIVADAANPKRALGVITATKSPAWSRGQVKFALTPSDTGWSGSYYMRDHSEEPTPAAFLGRGSVLRFGAPAVDWVRVNPAPTVVVENVIPSSDFNLRRLSDRTAILRLPDFHGENRAKIEKLLVDNRALLESTPNLIIDVRDNGGGSDSSYDKLMAWLYTRPIYSIGVEFRASPRNADLYAEMLKDRSLPPDSLATIRRIIAGMRKGERAWVQADDKPFTITTYPKVMPSPNRVGILITGAGSSGDQFVLDARQSRKVTTFGGPTAGVIDYSNVLEVAVPSGRYRLQWSTSRSMRLPEEPIDNVGVQPDIPIGSEVDDPVRFVQAWLERQVD